MYILLFVVDASPFRSGVDWREERNTKADDTHKMSLGCLMIEFIVSVAYFFYCQVSSNTTGRIVLASSAAVCAPLDALSQR